MDIGTDDVVHVRVYHALDGTHTLSDVQTNIPRDQTISYFWGGAYLRLPAHVPLFQTEGLNTDEHVILMTMQMLHRLIND